MRTSTRHQLKQDQFSAAAQETVSWAVEHRTPLIYGLGALAIAVAIVLGVWFYIQQQDEAAGVALGQALQVYNAPVTSSGQTAAPEVKSFATSVDRAKAARAEFAAVADKYRHTRSGKIARYFMGLADQDAGNTAAAETELKQAADSGGPDLRSLAKFALAALYASTGKDAQAIPIYKDLIEHPTNTVAKTQAQLGLAGLYEAKQPQEARKLYEQVQKENAQSPAAQIAGDRLAELK